MASLPDKYATLCLSRKRKMLFLNSIIKVLHFAFGTAVSFRVGSLALGYTIAVAQVIATWSIGVGQLRCQ